MITTKCYFHHRTQADAAADIDHFVFHTANGKNCTFRRIDNSGKFIDTDHTLAHFKEDYYPELLDQQMYDNWFAEGGTTLKERAKVKVEEILATHQPPFVDPDICSKLQEVVDNTES